MLLVLSWSGNRRGSWKTAERLGRWCDKARVGVETPWWGDLPRSHAWSHPYHVAGDVPMQSSGREVREGG